MASSRFFATGDSSDESQHSASGSEDEVDVMSTQLGGAGQVKLVYSSSESEEEKRTIKTAKDKAFESIQSTLKALVNHLKISDYILVTKDWDTLAKQMEKNRAVVSKEGMPPAYLHTIALLNQNLNDTFANKEEVKKMASSNAKALSALRAKVKKVLTTQPLSGQLDAYLKKNPLPAGGLAAVAGDAKKKKKAESESESESESDTEKPAKKAGGLKKTARKDRSESESEDEEVKKRRIWRKERNVKQ
jgi:translation initiation factor 3 subunit C